MSKHGNGIHCRKCGGKHPVNRATLKASKSAEGFVCAKCKRAPKRGRPSAYA